MTSGDVRANVSSQCKYSAANAIRQVAGEDSQVVPQKSSVHVLINFREQVAVVHELHGHECLLVSDAGSEKLQSSTGIITFCLQS